MEKLITIELKDAKKIARLSKVADFEDPDQAIRIFGEDAEAYYKFLREIKAMEDNG